VGGACPNGGACLWVATSGGTLVPVMWPSGYSAKLDPLELVDAEGKTVVKGGDELVLVGGYAPVSASLCTHWQTMAFMVQRPVQGTARAWGDRGGHEAQTSGS
jgi:hypothetical protein